MNFNNHKEYDFESKEDPFSFLKGDDHDFNASLKGLEDMYENMMEPGKQQKKKDQEFQQKKQLLQEAVQYHPRKLNMNLQQNKYNNPNVVIGLPVHDSYHQGGQYYQQQQIQYAHVQQPQPGPFNQDLYAKQPINNNQVPQQQYQMQPQPPITNVQFQQQANYNYPQSNQVKPNYHFQHK